MPVCSLLISPINFTINLHKPTERSATKLFNDSDIILSLYTFSRQKNSINELLRFLKKMAASKPTL